MVSDVAGAVDHIGAAVMEVSGEQTDAFTEQMILAGLKFESVADSTEACAAKLQTLADQTKVVGIEEII